MTTRDGGAHRFMQAAGPGDRQPAARKLERRSRPGVARAALVAGAILSFALGFMSVTNWDSLRHQLAISFTRQPSPFSALSFTDPTALPSTSRPGRTTEFSFSITNREGRAVSYDYLVTASYGGGRLDSVENGRIQVPTGTTVDHLVRVTPRENSARYIFTVSLAGRPETIRFTTTQPTGTPSRR